jgi:Zn-dependent peptidase ImmA (M78 family)
LPLPEGIAGAIGRKRGRYFIFINSADQPVRRRFTLAHEYGHYVLGHDPVIDRQEDIEGKTARKRPEEAEANYFASEFLAPEQAVRSYVQARRLETFDLGAVVRLADYFGISATAARIRFEQAGYLPKKAQRDALDAQIAAKEHLSLIRDDQLEGPTDTLSRPMLDLGGRRVPAPVFRRVARAYTRGLVRLERLAEQVRLTPKQLEKQLTAAGVTPPESEDDDEE